MIEVLDTLRGSMRRGGSLARLGSMAPSEAGGRPPSGLPRCVLESRVQLAASLSEVSAASALVLGVFEFVFYWSVIVLLAAAGRWTVTRMGGRHG